MCMFKWTLKDQIENKGISQAQLAVKANVSKNTINVLCRGGTHSVSLRTLSKLCAALAVEPWSLVQFNPNQPLKNTTKGVSWAMNSM